MLGAIAIVGLLACGAPAPAPVDTDLPVSEADRTREAAEDIELSVGAWRRAPDAARYASVSNAVDRGLKLAPGDARLDLALGDAQANVLMDPMAGIPRFEPHLDAMSRPQVDAWLDALVRAGDLRRVADEHRARLGTDLDLDDPIAAQIADRARSEPSLGWRSVADAVAGAKLRSSVEGATRETVDRPIPGLPVLVEVLGVLDSGPWDVVIAAGEGEAWPQQAAIGVSDLADLRRPAAEMALYAPTRVEIAARHGDDTPIGLWIARDRVVATTDPQRTDAWIGAAERFSAGRMSGEVDVERVVRAEWAGAFRTGNGPR